MGKYYYNKDFFKKIQNESSAYWLGFLYADGCINRQYKNEKLKSMDLELGLSSVDKHHLEKFLNSLESNVEIKEKKTKLNGEVYTCSRVHICCTSMCRDLIELGCTPQKSLTLSFPSYDIVPKNLMKHFIRGYFDGDGCVSTVPDKGKPKIITSFVGTYEFLNGLSDFMIEEKVIDFKPKFHKKGNAYEIFIYGNEQIRKMLSWMYDDSKVYLDRKFNKYITYYEEYDKRLLENNQVNKVGVYYNKRTERYIASIYINGKRKQIGSFKCVEDAIKARKEAESQKQRARQVG